MGPLVYPWLCYLWGRYVRISLAGEVQSVNRVPEHCSYRALSCQSMRSQFPSPSRRHGKVISIRTKIRLTRRDYHESDSIPARRRLQVETFFASLADHAGTVTVIVQCSHHLVGSPCVGPTRRLLLQEPFLIHQRCIRDGVHMPPKNSSCSDRIGAIAADEQGVEWVHPCHRADHMAVPQNLPQPLSQIGYLVLLA